jgi:hypothetical protein
MLVLPKLQHVSEATTRAFRPEGRLSTLKKETIDGWSGGFQYKPFQIRTTTAEFDFSRTTDQRRVMFIPCSKSGVWYPYAQEVISSGVIQGRKVTDPRGASEISRRKMWQAVMRVLQILAHSDSKDDIHIHNDYRSLKADEQLLSRKIVKVDVTTALQGWTPNDGDDLFTLGWFLVLSQGEDDGNGSNKLDKILETYTISPKYTKEIDSKDHWQPIWYLNFQNQRIQTLKQPIKESKSYIPPIINPPFP